MLTVFSVPKPFKDHIDTIQRNAVRSWTLLDPEPEVILFGDEDGTMEVAREFRVRHIPQVERNEFGTPLLNDVFDKAQHLASHDTLCFVNTDIMLMSDFMQAVQQVAEWKRRFLVVGQRWNVNIDSLWDVDNSDWERRLRKYVAEHGELGVLYASDYFVFPRGLWHDLPPFALGRIYYDNWLIYRARSLRVPVVDATQSLLAVHQNHDYAHLNKGRSEFLNGPEALSNLEMAGGPDYYFTLADVTHVLTPLGPKVDFTPRLLWRRLRTLHIVYSYLGPLAHMAKVLLEPLRRVGLKL